MILIFGAPAVGGCPRRWFQRVIQFQDNRGVVVDEGQEVLAWTLAPLCAAVESILALLAVVEALVGTDQIIGISIMRRRPKGYNIDFPTLQHRNSLIQHAFMKPGA